jgi:putative ABC transport system substrate-binding protein
MHIVGDLEAAFRLAKQRRAGAVIVMFSAGFYVQRAQIGTLALENGLPAMGQLRDITAAGGLMSYGHETEDSFFRLAYFIDRLLKGAKPAELPVEQVATFRLVVNLRTAKALGLTLPQSILLRAMTTVIASNADQLSRYIDPPTVEMVESDSA